MDWLNYAAALETAARDYLVPVCGFGVAWCVIGVEAVIALVVFVAGPLAMRFLWRNRMAVLFIIGILTLAVVAGLLGSG